MTTFCSLCFKGRLSYRWKWFGLKSQTKFALARQSSYWNPSVEKYIEKLLCKYNEHNDKLMNINELSPNQVKKYSKEVHRLRPCIQLYQQILDKQNEIVEMQSISDSDEEFKVLFEEEKNSFQKDIDELKSQLLDFIIPKDEDDENNSILEIRAGAGGREAGIFASEMLSMYMKLADIKRWQFSILSKTDNIDGGLNHASASIIGKNVFGTLKYEIGVHRVQRIPVTETLGRLHTSTVTVIVLPQPSDVNVVLDMKDVKIDTFRSSGAGGQHVNKTDSAVRLTHIPTGIIVACQEERSQIKNKSKAIHILSAKLYDMERTRVRKEHQDVRKSQMGHGDRSERIRTYNFTQNRVTDHRISETLHSIDEFMLAGPSLFEMIDKLRTQEKAEALSSISER